MNARYFRIRDHYYTTTIYAQNIELWFISIYDVVLQSNQVGEFGIPLYNIKMISTYLPKFRRIDTTQEQYDTLSLLSKIGLATIYINKAQFSVEYPTLKIYLAQ